MNKIFRSNLVRIAFALVVTLGLAKLAVAASKSDAHVTQVIRDVRLLAAAAGTRPATVNDSVHEGEAVRTGGDSRAELTFTDQTITRLGSNTVFSYGKGAKEFDLSSGAALMVVPKEAGTVKINTAAATAAVTGFTALVESHAQGVNKWMIIEGQACVSKLNAPGEPCTTLRAGDMLILQPGTRGLGSIHQFDIKKTMETAKLVTGFGKLPKWALKDIEAAISGQGGGQNASSSGPKDPTGSDTIDQKAAASPSPASTPIPPPPGPGAAAKKRTGRP
jgi:FecR protein